MYRFVAITLLSLVSVTALADKEAEALKKCSQITDRLDRLICYDNLAQKSNADKKTEKAVTKPAVKPEANVVKENAAKAPKVAPKKIVVKSEEKTPAVEPTTEQTKAKQTREFGIKEKKKEEELVTKVFYTVEKLKKDPYGRYKIYFSNKQEWKQAESGYYRLKTGDRVSIEKGSLGSFWLGQENKKKRIKVKRVK